MHAAENRFPGPPSLSGAREGASVIVLGVGLAGEHASYVGCWMEGSLLSSIVAITRLHKRALEA